MSKQPSVGHICHLLCRKEWSGLWKRQNYHILYESELESFSFSSLFAGDRTFSNNKKKNCVLCLPELSS